MKTHSHDHNELLNSAIEELKIFPNEGIGQVRFGMRPSEVKLIMGSYVKNYGEWMGQSVDNDFCYGDIIISFSEEHIDEEKPHPIYCPPLHPHARVDAFFVDCSSNRVTVNDVTLNHITKELLCGMEINGNKPEVIDGSVCGIGDDVCFRNAGLSFQFETDGSFHYLEMFKRKDEN